MRAHVVVAEDRGAVAHTDHGAHLLADALVGDADDRGLGDVGMLVERGLDLGGVDVLAAADDDVLQPVDDVEVALVVEAAEVAGERTIRRGMRRRSPRGC